MKFIILFLLGYTNIFAQVNEEYILTNKSNNSDINYELFSCFIEFIDCENYENKYTKIEDVFEPINGEYIIYNFIKTYKGLSYTGEVKYFNDLLILKIEKSTNKIIDGFQFTKEWAELPPSSDLYRLTNKTIEIIDKLNIKNLEFRKLDNYEDILQDDSFIVIKR